LRDHRLHLIYFVERCSQKLLIITYENLKSLKFRTMNFISLSAVSRLLYPATRLTGRRPLRPFSRAAATLVSVRERPPFAPN
jgi:hypothetical protein